MGLSAAAGPTQTVDQPHHSRSSLLSWKRNTPRSPGTGPPSEKAPLPSHPRPQIGACCAQASSPQDVRWVCGVRAEEGGKEFHNNWRFQWFRSLGHRHRTSFRLPLWEKIKIKGGSSPVRQTLMKHLNFFGLRYRKHNNKLFFFAYNLLSCLSPTGKPAVKTGDRQHV